MMKKPYSAPELFAESFRVCEHIAGCSISGIPQQASETQCEYLFDSPNGPIPLFHENRICGILPDELEEYWGNTFGGQTLVSS